jgi:hypothetical protein
MGLPLAKEVEKELVLMRLLLESPPTRNPDDEVVLGTQLRSLSLTWLSKDVTE